MREEGRERVREGKREGGKEGGTKGRKERGGKGESIQVMECKMQSKVGGW